jgi:hypothetical protein
MDQAGRDPARRRSRCAGPIPVTRGPSSWPTRFWPRRPASRQYVDGLKFALDGAARLLWSTADAVRASTCQEVPGA